MRRYRRELVVEAYKTANCPSDEDTFVEAFIAAFQDLEVNNYGVAYCIFDCMTYDELAKLLLEKEGKTNSPENLNSEKAKLRKRASRAKKEIIELVGSMYKGE